MYRNRHGFTLIEIIAVLVLMSIVGAGILVRAMNTDHIDLMALAAGKRRACSAMPCRFLCTEVLQ
jgi:prepilin-type N-terminal cleavage/methylation domain-containing protein